MHVEEHGLHCVIIQRDNDSNCIKLFASVLKSIGAKIKRTSVKAPDLQAFFESVVKTLKREILDAFCIVNEKQLDHILSRGAKWCHNRRYHSARDNRPPIRDEAEPDVIDLTRGRMQCVEELGGQLKSYWPAA